jgi:uncharacterized protein YbcI
LSAEEIPGEVLAGISTELVQLHHRYYGKGPTRAKTFFRENTVVCILRGSLTAPEQTLVDEGDVDAVHQLRRSIRPTMEAPATAVVEKATGRTVTAYISEIRPDSDLAVEVFVLEPAPV